MAFKFRLLFVLVIAIFISLSTVGCSTLNIGQPKLENISYLPWYEQFKYWEPEQRANFAYDFWKLQKDDYNTLNAIDNKSPELIKYLKAKREFIDNVKLPLEIYLLSVKNGTPAGLQEKEVLEILTQLQLLIIEKTGGK